MEGAQTRPFAAKRGKMRYKIRNINMENKRSRFFKRNILVGGRRVRPGQTVTVDEEALDAVNPQYVAYPGEPWGRMHQLYAVPIDAIGAIETVAEEPPAPPEPVAPKKRGPKFKIANEEEAPEPIKTLAPLEEEIVIEPPATPEVAMEPEEYPADMTIEELNIIPEDDGSHELIGEPYAEDNQVANDPGMDIGLPPLIELPGEEAPASTSKRKKSKKGKSSKKKKQTGDNAEE